MAEVRLDRVTKEFGDVVAVKDFTLDIFDKEFLVLVGPSGCGKSTTLRMVAGLEDPTTGDVYIEDALVNNVPPKDRDIAMVFQNYALYPHMNVYNNMAFGLRLHGYKRDAINTRVREAADILGIGDLLDRHPKELSGGQRQRVALGRAIVREPKVFLMDEPLSNLDAKLRVQMRTELIKLHSRLQTTVIYVTHDQIEAMTMGDRIVVMKDGVIQQVADPQTVYSEPANLFVAGFIGSPAMNFVPCRLDRSDGWALRGEGFVLPVPEQAREAAGRHASDDLVLGIRPEHIVADPAFVETHEAWTVEANIEVVEPMGAEMYLYFELGGVDITARVEPDYRFERGDTVRLTLNLARAHLFDTATELAVR